jgi:hypothetical protein
LPRTLNMRRFRLEEHENFFFLTGADKCIRRFSVLTIKKYADSQKENYSLKDILVENRTEFDSTNFEDYVKRRN